MELPATVPSEVTQQLEAARSERVRAGLIPGIAVFGLFAVVALAIPLAAGPINWRVPLLVTAALAVAMGACLHLLRSKDLAHRTGATFVIQLAPAPARSARLYRGRDA